MPDRPGHDFRYAVDSSKVMNELGWRPAVGFEQGLEDTVRWYLDNRAWTGGFALAGLVAAVGAWWFARGMARGGEQGSHDGDERS